MATRTVKARVELDGEKQYKQALSELNQGNKVLASEMRKLQAEYKGNTESTEYLTKAGDLLQRQLQQQQDKVAKLREALQASAEKYGEADKRTQDWVVKLNNAEAAEFDLQHAIEENNNALNGQNQEMAGLGDTVDQLASKLGINIPQGAKDALNGMQGLSAGTVAAMAAAAGAIAAIVSVVKELGQTTLEVASHVDNYITQSAITGVPTSMLQAWDYAAPLIDVDAETIKGSMTKITRALGDAGEGNEAAIASFDALGVSIHDDVTGELRSAEDVFYDVIDALGGIENQTQRDALAMDLMGKSAQDLNPLINQGSDALKEMADKAENAGYILDEYQIKRLGEVDDAYQKLQLQIDANKKQLAADFAPAAKEAMELFSDVVKKAGEMLERSGLIENLANIIESLISIVRTAGEIITGLPGFTTALDGLRVALNAVALVCATIADAANIIGGILSLDFNQVKTGLGWNINNGELSNIQRTLGYGDTSGQWYNQATGMWEGNYGHNASGNENWRGGLTWVGETGPELISLPRGSSVYSNQASKEFGGDTFYITIDAKSVKEFNDIVEMAKTARIRDRMR
jgi:predicted nuclease with TOPRIM domain